VILVVSNDVLITQLYKLQMAHLAIAIFILNDFSAAIDKIERCQYKAVFIALRRPFENALDFIAASRAGFPTVPIICTYESHDRSVLTSALRCGATYCLQEPIDPKMFELALRATQILD
jgi:DNA-binding response OmpR family regulator